MKARAFAPAGIARQRRAKKRKAGEAAHPIRTRGACAQTDARDLAKKKKANGRKRA